ncbi:MAG TPA: FAD-dependent oxidoreductase, partial [Symbiobacteriaceae bacterium]|nr:FAD-dependent oxidoreductase [Symbiobacteriaceae bacterium]
PPIPGVDGPGVITSDQILSLTEQPDRLVIIGGGVIGVEIAAIFAAVGTRVTVVEAMPRILPGADAELTDLMVRELEHMGVTVRTGAKVQRIEGAPGALRVLVEGGEAAEGDLVLVAAGRRPNLDGLEALDLERHKGGIVTDDRMLTRVPGVAAAGDVVAGRPMLAHVAFHEAKVAVENLLGHQARMDYRAVPQCIFGPLDLAQVGLTEAEAVARGYDVKVGRFPMAASGRAQTLGETAGLVKVVSEARHGEILGVHMLGAHAAEFLGEVTLALNLEATLDEVTETMHMHPTLSESILEAMADVHGAALHLPRRRTPAAAGR